MFQVNLPFVLTINPQSNKFVMGVKNKATVDSKLNDSPVWKVKGRQFHFQFSQWMHWNKDLKYKQMLNTDLLVFDH